MIMFWYESFYYLVVFFGIKLLKILVDSDIIGLIVRL